MIGEEIAWHVMEVLGESVTLAHGDARLQARYARHMQDSHTICMRTETITAQKEQDDQAYQIVCIFCGEVAHHLDVSDINASYEAHCVWHHSQIANLGNAKTDMCASVAI